MGTEGIKGNREEGSEEASRSLACVAVGSSLTQKVLEEDRVWRERVLSQTHTE